MKKVNIFYGDKVNKKPKPKTKYISLDKVEIKETVFDSYLCGSRGWEEGLLRPDFFDKVVYLGKSERDGGDMFACYKDEDIIIYKGIKGNEFN